MIKSARDILLDFVGGDTVDRAELRAAVATIAYAWEEMLSHGSAAICEPDGDVKAAAVEDMLYCMVQYEAEMDDMEIDVSPVNALTSLVLRHRASRFAK